MVNKQKQEKVTKWLNFIKNKGIFPLKMWCHVGGFFFSPFNIEHLPTYRVATFMFSHTFSNIWNHIFWDSLKANLVQILAKEFLNSCSIKQHYTGTVFVIRILAILLRIDLDSCSIKQQTTVQCLSESLQFYRGQIVGSYNYSNRPTEKNDYLLLAWYLFGQQTGWLNAKFAS